MRFKLLTASLAVSLLVATTASAEVRIWAGSFYGGVATDAATTGHRSVSGYLFDTNASIFTCGVWAPTVGPAAGQEQAFCMVEDLANPSLSYYCTSTDPAHVAVLAGITSTSAVYFEIPAVSGSPTLTGPTCTEISVWSGRGDPAWEIPAVHPRRLN